MNRQPSICYAIAPKIISAFGAEVQLSSAILAIQHKSDVNEGLEEGGIGDETDTCDS